MFMLQKIMINANNGFKINLKMMERNKKMFNLIKVRRKNLREEIDQLDLLFAWINSSEID